MALDSILIVGKQSKTHQMLRPFVAQIYAADDIADIDSIMDSVTPDLVILDSDISTDDIRVSIEKINAQETPVVVLSETNRPSTRQEFIEMGAYDCLNISKNLNQFGTIVDRIQNGDLVKDLADRFFVNECPSAVSIVGKSMATKKELEMINLVAKSACNPILIVGETGTGKELAARAVHVLRHGSDQKFVAVNCAALTANLLESELFGHVKGSFTSADREKTGLLELASNGTIFLDEISEMPLDLQAKLLRVLQEKTFRKVGGLEDIQCQATIIATSNRNLLKEVENGHFRRDLYYRLSICPINLAPLRATERKNDILLLAEFFINESMICPEKQGKIKGLTKLAAESLLKYNWPGNVRELKNVIERAILLESTDRIGTTNLMLNQDLYEYDEKPRQTASIALKDFSLEKAEKELVKRALDESGWQKTRAASLLGITRATLYAKVKQYNLQEPAKEEAVVC